MIWIQVHPNASPEYLGLIPSFLDEADERSAVDQLNANYIGGWVESTGCTIDPETRALKYPGDPPLSPLFITMMRDELVILYDCSMLAVVQRDNSYRVARFS